MRRMIATTRFGAMLILGGMFMASPAVGALLIDEPFDTEGNLDASPRYDDWDYVYTALGPEDWPAPSVSLWGEPYDGLRMARDGSDARNPHVFFTGTTIADLQGSAIFNTNNSDMDDWAMGYHLRADVTNDTHAGYIVSVGNRDSHAPELDTPFIGIALGTESSIHQRTRGGFLAVTDIDERLSNNTDYVINFSATGSTISASIWTTDATPELLGSVTYSDAANTDAGYFGFASLQGSSSGRYDVRDLEVIPEPGTASLLLGSLAVLGLLRRRMRR